MTQFIEIPANKISLSGRKSVYGIGINDADYMVQIMIDGKAVRCPYYVTWSSMIERCYSKKCQEKHPTYKGCSVASEWLTFSNFKAWMVRQDWKGNELDKDILIAGNKIYSSESCMFVSSQINSLLNDSRGKRGDFPQGVYFEKQCGKYRSRCNVNGKLVSIGMFSEIEAAEIAYLKFKASHISTVAKSEGGKLYAALLRHAKLMTDKAIKIQLLLSPTDQSTLFET